jgi:hypothetical protein
VFYHSRTAVTVLGIYLDFDQFMMIQRVIDGAQHGRGQTVCAYDDDRFPGMGQGFEMAFLLIVEHMMEKSLVSAAAEGTTLASRAKTFTVAPSPFNTVKFDLGIILISGILLLLVHGRITRSPLLQFLLLLGYGIMGMGWIVFRTRRIRVQVQSARGQTSDEPQ